MSAARAVARLGLMTAAFLVLAGCGRSEREGGNEVARSNGPAAHAGAAGVTPMAERVAVLGVLNKRNGIVRDVALRPGQSAKWKDLIVRLSACEKSAPWENERLTGAFVQVDVQRPDRAWSRVFSGWLYKESPSLNVVEHAVYDVWVKSCEMTFPAGKDAPGPAAPSATSSRPSSAPNSGSAKPAPANPAPAPAAEPAAPIAAESNTQ